MTTRQTYYTDVSMKKSTDCPIHFHSLSKLELYYLIAFDVLYSSVWYFQILIYLKNFSFIRFAFILEPF